MSTTAVRNLGEVRMTQGGGCGPWCMRPQAWRWRTLGIVTEGRCANGPGGVDWVIRSPPDPTGSDARRGNPAPGHAPRPPAAPDAARRLAAGGAAGRRAGPPLALLQPRAGAAGLQLARPPPGTDPRVPLLERCASWRSPPATWTSSSEARGRASAADRGGVQTLSLDGRTPASSSADRGRGARDVRRHERHLGARAGPPPAQRGRRAGVALHRARRAAARGAGPLLPRAVLPGAHPAGGRPGAPLPLHLQPEPVAGGTAAPPRAQHHALRAHQGPHQHGALAPVPHSSTASTSSPWRT
jgi:hypothetical protein